MIFSRKIYNRIWRKKFFEDLLKKAAANPAYRPEFNKRILAEKLVVITKGGELEKGQQIAKENTQISLLVLEDPKVPVFTSTDRIFDNGVIKKQVNFLELNAKDLFEFAKDATFLLNPYSDYGKELLPDEIKRILDGTIHSGQSVTFKKPTNIRFGQPAVYPVKIIQALKIIFEEMKNVKKAYLGYIQILESDELPHYVFGIDCDNDWELTRDKIGYVIKQFLSSKEFVDIVQMDKKNDISDYLSKTKPFYKK